MGLLDQVMGMMGGKGNPDQLLGAVSGLLGKDSPVGGLQGILSKLDDAGLDDVVKSWISTGENKAVSPAQVKQALGREELKAVAEQAGVDEDQAADGLAKLLPDLVDKLSPDGTLPDTGNLDELLKGVLGK
jgi:uncharacterized protein YidB (DUF937 family)